jgi:hypothetical protein
VIGTRMSFRLVSQLKGWLVVEHEVRKTREKREDGAV